jgi:arylsulfatase A-like enzyme
MYQRQSNRRDFILNTGTALAGLGLSSLLFPEAAQSKTSGSPSKQPNVIFILIDDLGWMDTEPYGSTYYETPNINKLAGMSVRFTQAYAANPFCSPTRASILTGKYPARLRITAPACHLPEVDSPLMPEVGNPADKMLLPRSRRYLPLDEFTLAEALKEQGYKTGFIGKWHLGHDEKYWPQYQGFDVNTGGGMWPGPPSYFSPYRISQLPDGPEGEYITDRLSDEALKFLDDHHQEPFFLCYWHYAVHAPYQSKEDLRQMFTGKNDPRSAQHNAVMAGMIKSMDESIGQLMDKLEQLGIEEDTILIFFSDNGGNMYDRTAPDGTAYQAQGPRGRRPTNNAPLRSGKGSIYEGGIRVPLMVRWPGVTQPNTLCEEPVCSVDFYPTILDMLGVEKPRQQTLDGVSLAPLLKKGKAPERDEIFIHYPHHVPILPCRACTAVIQKGRWKLIRFHDETTEAFPDKFELYDLKFDIAELNNLAGEMPEKVKELDALIEQHLQDTEALYPKPNPAYNPESLE